MRYTKRQREALPLIQYYFRCERSSPVKGFTWLCRAVCDRTSIIREEPAFLVPKSYLDGSMSESTISPDGKYHFEASIISLTDERRYSSKSILSQAGHPSPQVLDFQQMGGLVGLFSPDSKFLVGFTVHDSHFLTLPEIREEEYRFQGSFYLVECATRKARRLFTPIHPRGGCFYRWGWYPNSRHIWLWCVEHEPDERKAHIYRYDVRSHRRQVLLGKEREAIFDDWYLQDPRYRYPRSHFPVSQEDADKPLLVYARNQAVRLCVKDALKANGSAEVFVEWRDGRRQRLLGKGEHRWLLIRPLDISDDGRWGVLECLDGRKSEKGYVEEWISAEVQVWDVVAGRNYIYLTKHGSHLQFARDAKGAVMFGSAL